jgi:bifunctional DNA-binding transcriptional regulator/antitoxin component of YhaV-PrlF toxin-antitoxin module
MVADMGLRSKVGLAKTGTSSLRTTIPEGIVEYLNLKPGDILEWSMEIIDSARVTVVRKVRN